MVCRNAECRWGSWSARTRAYPSLTLRDAASGLIRKRTQYSALMPRKLQTRERDSLSVAVWAIRGPAAQQVTAARPKLLRVRICTSHRSASAGTTPDGGAEVRVVLGIEGIEAEIPIANSSVGSYDVDRAPIVAIRVFARILLRDPLLRIAQQPEGQTKARRKAPVGLHRIGADPYQHDIASEEAVILLGEGAHLGG